MSLPFFRKGSRYHEKKNTFYGDADGETVFVSGAPWISDLYDRTDYPAAAGIPLVPDELGWNDCGKDICRIEKLYGSV